jgi:hypothetical protein
MALSPSLGRQRTKLKLGAGFAVGFGAAGQAAVTGVGRAIGTAIGGAAAGLAETAAVGRGVTAMAGTSDTSTATVAAISENVAGDIPAVADQSLEFGALTRAGYGGTIPINTGSAFTNAQFTPTGNPSGHWSINQTTGEITPSATGAAAQLSLGTYTLGCTFSNANGSDTATITVYTQRTDGSGVNLAISRSVANNAQLTTEMASSGLTYGGNILLRTGDYNYSQADNRVFRSTTTAGVWNAYGTIDDAWMADNWITVRPHAGAVPVIYYMLLRSDGGSPSWRMKFKDLLFRNSEQNSAVNGRGLFGSYSTTGNFVSDVWVDSCTFEGVNNGPDGLNFNPGSRANAALGGRIRVTECNFTGCDNNIYAAGVDCYIVGNEGTGQTGDFVQLLPPLNRSIVRWNKLNGYTEAFTELTILATTRTNPFTCTVSLADAALVGNGHNWVISIPTDSAVDGRFRATSAGTTVNQSTGVVTFTGLNGISFATYTGGGKLYAYLSHGDFCQFRNDIAVDGDFDDIDFSGNIIVSNPTTTRYTQGMAGAIGTASGSLYYRRLRARGNIFIGKQQNALSFGQCVNSDVSWNTVIDYPDYTTQIQPQLTPTILCNTGTGNNIKYNIYHSFSASGATLTGNQQLTRGDTATYANEFVNPVGLLDPVIDAPADYALSPSGSWYALSPQVGATPYVNFTARETSFPDEATSNSGAGSVTAFALTNATGLGLQTSGAGSSAGVAATSAVGDTVAGAVATVSFGAAAFDSGYRGNSLG